MRKAGVLRVGSLSGSCQPADIRKRTSCPTQRVHGEVEPCLGPSARGAAGQQCAKQAHALECQPADTTRKGTPHAAPRPFKPLTAYSGGPHAFRNARVTIVSLMFRALPSAISGAGACRIIRSNSSAGTGGLQ